MSILISEQYSPAKTEYMGVVGNLSPIITINSAQKRTSFHMVLWFICVIDIVLKKGWFIIKLCVSSTPLKPFFNPHRRKIVESKGWKWVSAYSQFFFCFILITQILPLFVIINYFLCCRYKWELLGSYWLLLPSAFCL